MATGTLGLSNVRVLTLAYLPPWYWSINLNDTDEAAYKQHCTEKAPKDGNLWLDDNSKDLSRCSTGLPLGCRSSRYDRYHFSLLFPFAEDFEKFCWESCHFFSHIFLWSIPFFLFSFFFSEIKGDKGISRGGPSCGVSYGNFRLHKFSFLNITVISEALVEQTAQCSFACLETPECFSFNLGAFPDSNEKLLCKLLPSDKYNNSHEFLPNGLFHHFSIAVSWVSWTV